jgi:predicted Zn-dependent protease
VKLIHKDDVLNAFCTPGGFIYVYSGLIHYLDAEAHLAGVIGHAERRHSSMRLQKEFVVRRLLEFVVLTRPMALGDVANAAIVKELVTPRYSRDQETEADDYSVRILSSTNYACDGTAGFFQKIQEEGDGVRIPEFLSDHPDPAARVQAIRAKASELGCSTSLKEAGPKARLSDYQVPTANPPVSVASREPGRC